MSERVTRDGLFRDERQRGFTLIETCIAIIVLTFGLVSVVGVSVYISRANSISSTQSVLTNAAQSYADELRAAIWTRIIEDPRISVGGSLTEDIENHFTIEEDTPVGTLLIRWQVADGPGTTGDVRTITLRVVQEEPAPHVRDGISVTTIINRN